MLENHAYYISFEFITLVCRFPFHARLMEASDFAANEAHSPAGIRFRSPALLTARWVKVPAGV